MLLLHDSCLSLASPLATFLSFLFLLSKSPHPALCFSLKLPSPNSLFLSYSPSCSVFAPEIFSSPNQQTHNSPNPLCFFVSKTTHPTIYFFSKKNTPCFSSKLFLALAKKTSFFPLHTSSFSSQNVPCFSSSSSFSHSLLNEAPLDHPFLNSSPSFLLPYFSLNPCSIFFSTKLLPASLLTL